MYQLGQKLFTILCPLNNIYFDLWIILKHIDVQDLGLVKSYQKHKIECTPLNFMAMGKV